MMPPTLTASAPALREAFYALSLGRRIPDSDLLDDVVRRYPQYAAELTEFAVDLVLDALHDATIGTVELDTDEDPMAVTPAVSRAMSRFHNRLHAVSKRGSASLEGQSLTDSRSVPVNPFEALSRDEFRDLVSQLDATTAFIVKLRDRHIDPDTMSDGFRQCVADRLKVPLDVVVAHSAATQTTTLTGRQFYKADEQPSATEQQSFAEAVRSSGLSEAQQQRLMSL